MQNIKRRGTTVITPASGLVNSQLYEYNLHNFDIFQTQMTRAKRARFDNLIAEKNRYFIVLAHKKFRFCSKRHLAIFPPKQILIASTIYLHLSRF